MKKTLAAILALVLTLSLCSLAWATQPPANVAKIGDNEYATLQAAVNEVKNGETITLLRNVTDGDGVVVKTGQNIIFDFAGYTYTINGKLVGSSGSETNGFQLLKGSTVAMRNGTIIAGDNATGVASNGLWNGSAAILIQNYAALTLDGMTLTGGNRTYYVLSNNNGETVINDTVITAGNGGNKIAFDVYGNFGDYDDVKVTVKGNSIINGDVEVDRDSKIPDTQNANTLVIVDGKFNDELKVTKGTVSVSGGTFSSAVDTTYLADTVNYKVSGTNSVSYFTNLNDAVAAAGADDEVKNLKETSAHSGSTVTLKDGDTVITKLHTEAATVDLPTLSKSGYTFKGWKDEDGKVYNGKLTILEENGGELVVREAVTLTAVWSANSYYYYPSTSTTDSTTGKASPKTFDAGIGVYAVTAVLSLTGLAYTGKKKF
jgi:uncharacterized repeat protein (TIGR02543 family)